MKTAQIEIEQEIEDKRQVMEETAKSKLEA